jgi:class 3 adenylate cyclase/CheY-like chemotaxis protein
LTPPQPPAAASPPSRLTRTAWLADLRQELLAPVNAALHLARMLLKDARERGPHDFAADLEKVHASGQRLLALVQGLLDPACHAGNGDLGKKVRHDLRTPLNGIIGYCELWLEDADESLSGGFGEDLTALRNLGRKLLSRLDDLCRFSEVASDPDIDLGAQLPAMIRGVVDSLPAARPAPAAEKGTFLVVDDNEVNRDLLCRWLRRAGHTALVAEDGERALAVLARTPVDVVLLDLIMPGLNGFQVLERLKADEALRHLPVVMISAFNEVDGVVRCIEMGAEDYLTKPFNPVLLQARINACLEKKRLRDREAALLEEVRKEQKRADELLHVILPGEVVRELKAANAVRPRRYEDVAVMFCDIVGFTPFCDGHAPEFVVQYLQQLIEVWEEIALKHGVQKIKTIGDAFMAAAGLLQPTQDHPVLHCVRCGLEMVAATRALPVGWDLRVGIHAGPVVAGVIGRRQYLFDLWGDTVNTAARMESHGVPGAVVLSGPAWQEIAAGCRGTSRGVIPVKGKGQLEMVRFDGFLGR